MTGMKGLMDYGDTPPSSGKKVEDTKMLDTTAREKHNSPENNSMARDTTSGTKHGALGAKPAHGSKK